MIIGSGYRRAIDVGLRAGAVSSRCQRRSDAHDHRTARGAADDGRSVSPWRGSASRGRRTNASDSARTAARHRSHPASADRLRHDQLQIRGRADLSRQEETSSSADLKVGTTGILSKFVEATLHGNIAHTSSSESTTNRGGTLEIMVRASQSAMPVGLLSGSNPSVRVCGDGFAVFSLGVSKKRRHLSCTGSLRRSAAITLCNTRSSSDLAWSSRFKGVRYGSSAA
jgi:hypothetical protein